MSQPETPARRAPAVPPDLREPPATAPGAGPFRVLLVQPSKRPRAGDWLVRVAGALRGRGHAALLLAPEESETATAARQGGIEVQNLPSVRALDPRTWWFLRRMARTWRPEGLLLPDSGAMGWMRRAGRGSRWPQALWARPSMNGAGASHGAAGDIIAASDTSQAVGVAAGLPISDEPLPIDPTKLRRELRISRRHAIILQQDAFVHDAGHAVTLHAIARLRDRYEPGRRTPQLALLGTGPAESDLHVLSHDLQLQQCILWIGSRKDAGRYLRAANVVVAPASTAGSPQVILEALAAGVPVVAADAPAHRGLITPGVTGLLVTSGDAGALAEALDTLLRDPERAAAMARAGREHARSAWGRERLGLQLELLLAAGVLAHERRTRLRPAVFVDRDGTLVRNVPYNADPEAVVLEPDVAWVLGRFREAGCAVVVVSNQSAVARGLCTEEQVRTVNDRVVELLRAGGADVDRIEICPHHPDHGPPCGCRKPQPGMLLRAAKELDLDLEASVTIGDEMRDLEAGERAGTATVAYAGDWLGTGCAALGAVVRRLRASGGTASIR